MIAPVGLIGWLFSSSALVKLGFAGLYAFACHRLARDRHRSTLGWPLAGALAGWFLQVIGIAVPILLYTRGKIDLRRHYLELKYGERLLAALGASDLEHVPVEERLLMVLANNPEGLHLNALAQGVGKSWRAIEEPIERLRLAGKIHLRGELYFIDTLEPAPDREASEVAS